jgi:DNA-binding IclR family transcriptional regulator
VRSRDGRAVAAINVGAQAARVECQTMMRDYVPVLPGAAEAIAVALAPQAIIARRVR